MGQGQPGPKQHGGRDANPEPGQVRNQREQERETYVDNIIYAYVSDFDSYENSATANVLKIISYSPAITTAHNNSLVNNHFKSDGLVYDQGSNNVLANNIFNSSASAEDKVLFFSDEQTSRSCPTCSRTACRLITSLWGAL